VALQLRRAYVARQRQALAAQARRGDTLIGNVVANVLNGGWGNDHIEGGAGDDELDGSLGVDVLNGGDGTDTCVAGETLNSCEL
jgi:Ca2+-binding RTX toxin-like protein